MNEAAAPAPLTVGTAGHIDHGKTLLVEKLTGMRADRPYERERGMTIDIGYAEMRTPDGRRVGFVDLPGHERFIRNMVAGATGIDLALVVVAADDGVMPQTEEHVGILELLGIRRALVVLNKVDLVDEETRDLAEEELREFLSGTALKDAPILSCSAATGRGVDAVRTRLLEMVSGAEAGEEGGAFFMAVQRTFAAAGFGCIVTGVPAAGRVAVGDELEVLPPGKRARVRAVEIYHEPAESARAGHRTALNLAGVHKDDLGRGMVVAEPGTYGAGRHLAARLRVLGTARRAVRHAGSLRLLTGTLEEMAQVYLLRGNTLKPGQEALVEIRTRHPVTVRDGAAFILRSDNAKDTVGGGVVVATLDEPIGRKDPAKHERLAAWADALSHPADRVRAALRIHGPAPAAAIARRCQLAKATAGALLARMREKGELVELAGGAYVPAAEVAAATERLRGALEAMHREQPLLAALPIAAVRDRAGLDEALLHAALESLGDAVVAEARQVRLAAHRVQLDDGLTRAAEDLLRSLREGHFAPPEKDKLAAAAGLADAEVRRALTLLRDRGTVREVAPGLVYPRDTLDEGLRLLKAVAAQRGSFEPVDAKAVLGGISRKWLIPLLEYYDRIGATRRDGNARLFTRRGETMAVKGVDAE